MNPEYLWFLLELDSDFKNLCDITNSIDCKWICIDIANGYISNFLNFVKKYVKLFLYIIVAGNVATREMVETLTIEVGVDIVLLESVLKCLYNKKKLVSVCLNKLRT